MLYLSETCQRGLIQVPVRRREWRAAENVVGCLLAGHDGRRVEIAVGDAGEDRGVRDTQPVDTNHTAFGVDHRMQIVRPADAAGAAG